MKATFPRISTTILTTGLLLSCQTYVPPIIVPPAPISTQLALHDGMRKLWTQHVLWTRVVIIAVVSNGPDLQAATDRLLQNQVDLGDAFKPWYGDDAGNQLTALLKEHIVQAADLLAAAKAGDMAKFNEVNTAWYANADRIAAFLAGLNPNWPQADLQQMMHDHLMLTLNEATAQFSGNWDADVQAYDAVVNEILTMADTFTDGIAAQFPEKITSPSTTATHDTLHVALRKLWEDHVMWTRVVIIDDTGNLPGTPSATTRLLQNQVDLGDAIKPYYGNAAGDQLAALLKEHINGAVRVLDAAETGDMNAVNAAYADWQKNADDISAFLANANPNISLGAITDLMHMHLQQTLTEASKRLMMDYVGEVQAYDVVEDHILHMSDALSDAIDAQFPGGPPASP